MSTFVLIHGGFCRGWIWAETAAALQEDGHWVEVVDLPSGGTAAAELGDLQADVAAVRRALSVATPTTVPPARHPTTYIVCEQDQALPPQAQEAMSAAADRVVRLPSSHSPFLPVHPQAAGKSPRRRHQLNLTQTCAVNMIAVQPACN